MARKKDIKPLLAVKHDFVDALDNVLDRALVLHGALSSAFDLGLLPKEGPVWESYQRFSKSVFGEAV